MEKFSFARWSLMTAGIMLFATLSLYLLFVRYSPIIPDEFTYTANILSYDNFYDTVKKDFSGEILSKTRYSYWVDKKENNVLTIRNIFDVRRPSGEPIFKAERLYGIDQITGKHVPGYGDKDRDGYLFAPKNPGKEFIYWHINYDMPAHMKLRGKEYIEGLRVYRYECNYKADQTENLTFLPGVSKDRGVELDINLQLWIEPTTGYLVKYEDHTTAWYYDLKTRKRIHPWNRFHNKFEETSISKQVQIVLLAKEKGVWQNRYLPLSNFVLILIVLSLGYPERKKIWRPYIATGLTVGIGLTAAILLHLSLKKTNDVRMETIFTRDCESLRTSIQRELERSVDILNSVKINYVSLKQMSREQFRTIARLSLKNNENVRAIGFIPIVPIAKRDSFELQAQHEGLTNFHFTELKNGETVPAGERSTYFPVYFLEPVEKNKSILGYDLGSNKSPTDALEKASATGEATSTGSILYSPAKNKYDEAFLILIPVYKDELGLSTTHTAHAFLSVSINIYSLIQGSIDRTTLSTNTTFTIVDPEAKPEDTLFSNTIQGSKYLLAKSSTLQVANRPWLLKFCCPPIFSSFESLLFTVLLPLGVVLMTVFLGIFIFRILTDNQLLNLAHIISHNLRSPVENLKSLLSFYKESESKEDKEMLLSKFTTVINHLTTTLNELMEVWRIQKDVRKEREMLSFEDTYFRTKDTFAGFLLDTNAKVTCNFKVPKIHYPKSYLESIMLNLFSNAIKYRSTKRIPQIHFETTLRGKEIVLLVQDNGQGIDLEKYGSKLFGLNNTFHQHPEAKGVGLYITKTQIEEMGGSIAVESVLDKGTTFTIVFNKGTG